MTSVAQLEHAARLAHADRESRAKAAHNEAVEKRAQKARARAEREAAERELVLIRGEQAKLKQEAAERRARRAAA